MGAQTMLMLGQMADAPIVVSDEEQLSPWSDTEPMTPTQYQVIESSDSEGEPKLSAAEIANIRNAW